MIDSAIWNVAGFRPRLIVTVHQEQFGNIVGSDRRWVGIKGQSKRLEGFAISFEDKIPSLVLEYRGHIEKTGDTPWVSEAYCGTMGESKRLEGIELRLSGENAKFFRVKYGVHIENSGDTGITETGYMGTKGQARRIEAVYVEVQHR